MSSFKAAQKKAWQTLGRDASTVFATNLPSRDGLARVEIARGNRAAAIEEYRRLTAVGPGQALVCSARASQHSRAGASTGRSKETRPARASSTERFLKLWANADAGLPELSEVKTAIAAERR